MPRTANATDFAVDVDRQGRFIFARRSVGDIYKIRGRYHQATDGFYDADGNMADISALAYVTIQTLMVSGPEGFDVDLIDPLLDDDYDTKILAIWRALRNKELSFRPKQDKVSKEGGAGAGELAPAVVPGQVQPSAD
jgi:hypothetical protein